MRVICPVIAQLHPGSVRNRTRAGESKLPADPEVTEQHPSGEDDDLDVSPASLPGMKAMTTDGLLEHLASLGIPAASQLQEVCAEQRELTGGLRNGIRAARVHARTNEGRQVYQTVLAAAARDGDGPSRLTARHKAELLGVDPNLMEDAKQRAESLWTDVRPAAAMGEDKYWFHPRSKRTSLKRKRRGASLIRRAGPTEWLV
ncbi:unnamed protein product [Pylaiella littoralis]